MHYLTNMFGVDISLLIAIGSTAVSVLGWYSSTIRNRYARERESAHILRNLEQQTQAFSQVFKDFDKLDDRMSRLEVLLLRKGVSHADD